MEDENNPFLESRESLNARLHTALAELQEHKETIKILEEQIKPKEEMMFDLVWLARCKSPEGQEGKRRVLAKYPEEAAKLEDWEGGNWQHGFNSGVLAMSRLVLGIIGAPEFASKLIAADRPGVATVDEVKKMHIDFVISSFPKLDT